MKDKESIPVLIAEIQQELSKLDKLVNKLVKQKNLAQNEESLESAALRFAQFLYRV